MTKYHRNNMRMTVSRFHNSEHNHKTGGDKSSMGKIKCNINNITCDIINCSENGRFNQCTKRHHCNGAKSNNEKPNEEKRHRERRKVKYDHEKGKTGLPARSIESKCEKYIVKISNISKYTVEENEFSTGKNTLSSDDLIICRNYKMSHFLCKKCERKSDEQNELALVRDKREMREEVEGANGNENRSSQLCLNWVHSMSDGGNNNAVISVEEKKEGSEKDEQETVNDELKDVAPLLKHNETEQAGDEGKLNDNVGEHTSAHGNINKSNSTATLFNINLHSLCQFTKTIPKQLLRMARISKTILEEELTKRKLRETPRQQNATRDDEMDDLNRPNQSSNEVRNDKIVRRAGTSKFWVDLETWINLDRNMDVLSSLCPDATNSKDELKDNALEEEEDEEEELKDELGEMGSNISRHSGKGLSGRRTQSSGNLCNGKLVSNVGKLLVPCTKQGDELTSPNRYKLCASLPNYLEKENLDDLEPCKFPYGINNNNNNNNNELEFYDIKKELDFGLKPILRANSRSEDYVTKEKKDCKPDRSPDEECPPDILNQQILQDRGGGGEDRTGSDQQLCQVHPFVNQNSSTFLVCIEKGTRGLGLSVMGGCDTEDHLIRIKRIFPHTPAAQCGVLCQGDVILTVNDVPLTGLTNYEALEVLRMTYNIVHLKVYRPPDVSQNQIPDPPSDPPPPPPKREALSNILVPVFPADEDEASREFDIVLTKHNGSLGFTLRKEDESVLGHYVRALVREPALSDGRIQQGDKIVAVNGVEMSRMSHEEAVQFLRQCGEDVRLRLYRDATQTPVAALSPCRQHKQLKPILRKEAMDMLSDLAVKKLSPQPSTNSSRSSSPRCRKLKPSSDQNSQHHPDSRILSPTRPDSLDFNNREKKTRYQFSSPESDTGTPSSCSSSNSSSIASQILPPPLQAPPPMLDEPASLPPALPSSPPPLPHSHEPASMPPLFSSPESPPYFLIKDTDDPYKASMDLSKSYPNPSDPYKASMDLSKSYTTSSNPYKASMDLSQSKCCTNSNEPYKANMELGQSKSYPHPSPTLYQDAEPSSMPPLGSETLTSDAFTHGNPSYQSTIPVSSKKLEAKLDNGAASIPDLPAMLSPPPVESSKGLLKWKGVVFSPDESGDQMDSIKPPLAFSVSSDGDDQIVVVELNRGWNSRLGFSLADGPESSTVISAIHADSVASRDGRLKVGDQIVMVNDESVEAMSTPDIIDLLRKIRGSICIRVHRKNKVKSASKEI